MKLNPAKSVTSAKSADDQPNHTLSYHVTNCTAKDAQFIGGVIRLFCDPELALIAAELRKGTLAIEYKSDTGEAFAFDLKQTIKAACCPGAN